MKRNKKASLSLSINAIVILVLAITMLGLGLGFTKGMFSKFASKLEVPPPNIPATPEEPIVLPDESIEILKNKDFEFSVNFYNDWTGGVVYPSMVCSPGLSINATAIQQTVQSGTFKMFKFLVDAPGTAGKSICTLTFADAATPATAANIEEKQITIVSK